MPSVQHQHLNSYFCYGPSDWLCWLSQNDLHGRGRELYFKLGCHALWVSYDLSESLKWRRTGEMKTTFHHELTQYWKRHMWRGRMCCMFPSTHIKIDLSNPWSHLNRRFFMSSNLPQKPLLHLQWNISASLTWHAAPFLQGSGWQGLLPHSPTPLPYWLLPPFSCRLSTRLLTSSKRTQPTRPVATAVLSLTLQERGGAGC